MAPARRSTRTLVTKFESGAARETQRKTKAQRIGAWPDPHPTAGLATFSATLPDAQAAQIMDLVEKRARELQQDHERDGDSSGAGGGASRYVGQYRADAIYEIVTRNLTYTLELHVLDPIGDACGFDCSNRAAHPRRG
ncbi:hypothetical protein IEE94_14865 [Yimella sp. cx-573]|nr:hypothetical protein [Yimella sp. cx-573]